MNGLKMKPSATSNPPSNGTKEFGETCVISAGSNMEGMFSSSENVRLDGFVKGEIKCSQRFVMGENGRVEGNLYSNDAIIMGRIDGDVIVTDTLQLKSTGIIKGSITAKYMIVEEGAQYVGECKIGS